MARTTYYPDRGDLIHLNFSPSARQELAGPHYGLVLSTKSFAKATGFALICPITSNTTPWPFDVLIPPGILPPKQGRATASAILTDQIKSLDFRERQCEFVARAPDDVLDDALAKVRAILDSDDVLEELQP